MSTVCVLTPIVIGSWPAIASAVLGAAGAMGFTVASGEREADTRAGPRRIETEIPNSEVLAETLARGEKIRIVRDGVALEFGVDDRGRCTVCATGHAHSKADLERIAHDVAGRVVQQFAYHKLVSELKTRGYSIAEEGVEKDESIRLRVRLDR